MMPSYPTAGTIFVPAKAGPVMHFLYGRMVAERRCKAMFVSDLDRETRSLSAIGIPQGSYVEETYCQSLRGYALTIWNKSFDPVPEGQSPPAFDPNWAAAPESVDIRAQLEHAAGLFDSSVGA